MKRKRWYLLLTGVTADGFKTECMIRYRSVDFVHTIGQWVLNGTIYKNVTLLPLRVDYVSPDEIPRYYRSHDKPSWIRLNNIS